MAILAEWAWRMGPAERSSWRGPVHDAGCNDEAEGAGYAGAALGTTGTPGMAGKVTRQQRDLRLQVANSAKAHTKRFVMAEDGKSAWRFRRGKYARTVVQGQP